MQQSSLEVQDERSSM